jgi:hypothetical protein
MFVLISIFTDGDIAEARVQGAQRPCRGVGCPHLFLFFVWENGLCNSPTRKDAEL